VVEWEETVHVLTAQFVECCVVLGAPCQLEGVTWEERDGKHAVECDEAAYGNACVLKEALARCYTLLPSLLDEGVPMDSSAHSDLAPEVVLQQVESYSLWIPYSGCLLYGQPEVELEVLLWEQDLQ